eukprot:c43778_g1_i1 orf=117-320(-)
MQGFTHRFTMEIKEKQSTIDAFIHIITINIITTSHKQRHTEIKKKMNHSNRFNTGNINVSSRHTSTQ